MGPVGYGQDIRIGYHLSPAASPGRCCHFEIRGLSKNCCLKSMKRPGSPASLLFRLIVPACAAFVFTILVMIASIFGDSQAPVSRWFDRHLGTLLTVEFVATMLLALLAMTVDRIGTLRSGQDHSQMEQEVLPISPNQSGSDAES